MIAPPTPLERIFMADQILKSRNPPDAVHCFRSRICVSTTLDGGMFIFRAQRGKSGSGWTFKPIGGVR